MKVYRQYYVETKCNRMYQLIKMRTTLRIPLIVQGLFLGFLANILYQELNFLANVQTSTYSTKMIQKCLPCQTPVCGHCPPNKIDVKNNKFLSGFYKPNGMYEVTRWLYFDENHVCDIINDEPKVKSIGYWKEELKVTTQVGMDYVNKNKMLGQSWTFVKLQGGYTKVDSLRGTDFILDLLAIPKRSILPNKVQAKIHRVHMTHPFDEISNSRLKSIKKIKNQKITIIIPLQQDSAYAPTLIKELNQTVTDKNIQVFFVLYAGNSNDEKSKKDILETLSHYKNPHKLIEGSRDFLSEIQKIAELSPNDIILSLQNNMAIREGLFQHCRALCHQNRQVYFPIAFAQFEPGVTERGMPPGKPKNIDKKDHSRYTGNWEYNKRRSVCAYAGDWLKALPRIKYRSKARNTLDFQDWLFRRFIQNNYDIITAVEPHLYIVNHKLKCLKFKPFPTDYKQCANTKSTFYGSKIALGILHITESMQKKVKT